MFKIYNPYDTYVAFKLFDSDSQAQKHSEQIWRIISGVLDTKATDTWFLADNLENQILRHLIRVVIREVNLYRT